MVRVRLHTTISMDTERRLDVLSRKYGSRSKVVEMAVNALEHSETESGSCEDCTAKEDRMLRTVLNYVSMNESLLEAFFRVSLGEMEPSALVEEVRNLSRSDVFLYRQAAGEGGENDYETLLARIRSLEALTAMFTVMNEFEKEKVVLLRLNAFRQVPFIPLEILVGWLRGHGITFELDHKAQSVIRLKWVSPELHKYSRMAQETDTLLEEEYKTFRRRESPAQEQGVVPLPLSLIDHLVSQKGVHLPDEHVLNEFTRNLPDVRSTSSVDAIYNNLDILGRQGYIRNWDVRGESGRYSVSFEVPSEEVLPLFSLLVAATMYRNDLRLIRSSGTRRKVEMVFGEGENAVEGLSALLQEVDIHDLLRQRFFPEVVVPQLMHDPFVETCHARDPDHFATVYRDYGSSVGNALRLLFKDEDLAHKALRWVEEFLARELGDVGRVQMDLDRIRIVYQHPRETLMDAHLNILEGLFSTLGVHVDSSRSHNMVELDITKNG